MLKMINLSIIIWMSSSHALVNRRQDSSFSITPSENHADIETAKRNCEREFNGRLVRYNRHIVRLEIRRVLRQYNFEPCDEGENCEEYWVDIGSYTRCQVILTTSENNFRTITLEYRGCSSSRRYLCESATAPCDRPVTQERCNDTCNAVDKWSYNCTCKEGYVFNRRCIDIDECSSGTHECDENADCVNSVGSHQCNCSTGFVGDGKNCQVSSTTTTSTGSTRKTFITTGSSRTVTSTSDVGKTSTTKGSSQIVTSTSDVGKTSTTKVILTSSFHVIIAAISGLVVIFLLVVILRKGKSKSNESIASNYESSETYY